MVGKTFKFMVFRSPENAFASQKNEFKSIPPSRKGGCLC